jgi:acyl carrier protein
MTIEGRAHILEHLNPVLSRVSNGRAEVDHLSEDARIIEDVGLASLGLLELRCELEERWRLVLATRKRFD